MERQVVVVEGGSGGANYVNWNMTSEDVQLSTFFPYLFSIHILDLVSSIWIGCSRWQEKKQT